MSDDAVRKMLCRTYGPKKCESVWVTDLTVVATLCRHFVANPTAVVVDESGSLDEVADFHEAQLKSVIKSLSVLVTPAFIISVGTVVVTSTSPFS